MGAKSKYLWLGYDENIGYFLYVPISKLVWYTSFLPLFGFIFCIAWSVLFNFDDTTFTHCKVWNYLPSISAAIGNNMTQYVVWCTTITLHAPPRFLFVIIYYRYNMKILKHQSQYFSKLAGGLNILENISLLGLTYVSSSGAYEFHEKCFITFVVSSQFYMLITCLLLKYARKSNVVAKLDVFSIQMKTRLLVINFLSFIIAGYFFLRHNNYCEPGIYTFFAFFEYIVVFSNIGFHATAIIDFRDEFITVNKQGINIK